MNVLTRCLRGSRRGRLLIGVSCLMLLSLSGWGEVKLPRLVGDGMVLQRGVPVRIWGWAAVGEKVTVRFLDVAYGATADATGAWEVILPVLKPGGPYTMRIEGANRITINDILVGDVWVCSGQSNMGLALGWLGSVYQKDIDSAENPKIRQFQVQTGFTVKGPEKDVPGGQWVHADPKAVRNFTAVGYFFAKSLYDVLKVPIGLIHSSVGGTSTEAWMSEEALGAFPKYREIGRQFRKPGSLEQVMNQDDEKEAAWIAHVRQNDEGYATAGATWADPKTAMGNWDTIPLPGYWADTKLGLVNGAIWFRRGFQVPDSLAGKAGMLRLGRIVDADSVFVNGRFIGAMGSQYAPRFYRVPGGVLQAGDNTIVIRVVNYIRKGGFVPGKQYDLTVNGTSIGLVGTWKYRVGAVAAEPLEDRLFTFKIPMGHYNAMMAPLHPYAIKGVLWYQGESNSNRGFEHLELFKVLVRDWRKRWRQGDFPFVYVQLPNFVEVNAETTPTDWAFFRESQLKALGLPAMGMAVSIDIGEYNDIHPVNKKDLGYRLALEARRVAYGEKKLVSAGPIYSGMKVAGGRVHLTFRNTGRGLVVRNGGSLRWFEVCGTDGVYHPAEAKIEHGGVVVWSKDVPAPAAVRYAWANNPEGANLFNAEGLPATPFRTSELF